MSDWARCPVCGKQVANMLHHLQHPGGQKRAHNAELKSRNLSVPDDDTEEPAPKAKRKSTRKKATGKDSRPESASKSKRKEDDVATRTSPPKRTRKTTRAKTTQAKTSAKSSSNGGTRRIVHIDDLPAALVAEAEALAKAAHKYRNDDSEEAALIVREHAFRISGWAKRWYRSVSS